jgi:PhzF family phenazine biosynthesis protein
LEIQRLAAFSDGEFGGNPAGVVICDVLPGATTMQSVAAEVGYSETAFAAWENGRWRVRYFAPEAEVAFCGHATIALGAALCLRFGDGVFALQLNEAAISVEGRRDADGLAAFLQSPPTRSEPASKRVVGAALEVFGLSADQLERSIAPAIANAGVSHLVLALSSRKLLLGMHYDFEVGRSFMTSEEIGTVSLIFAETPRLFHARNPFPVGGVYEDPATGAAAAALGGYLRDIAWPHAGVIDIVQGEDMGCRSLLRAEIPPERGSSVRVSGRVRIIEP